MDLDKIVSADDGGIVRKSSATGLLPIWDKYLDEGLVAEKGFTYEPARAKQLREQVIVGEHRCE